MTRTILCLVLTVGAAVTFGQAQAPAPTQGVTLEGVQMHFVGVQDKGQLRMTNVFMRFPDGTELTADEMVARNVTDDVREVELTGKVRLRLRSAQK